MTGMPCITTITGSGGCRILGEHLSTCRGIRLEGTRAVACPGCLPQPATHGLLCDSCHERYVAAIDSAVDLITHLRSIERAPVPEGPKVHQKPGPRVILPTSWLTADALWEELRELAFRADVDDRFGIDGLWPYGIGVQDSIETVRDHVAACVEAVRAAAADGWLLGRVHTAQLVVAFYRAAQQALAMYPFEEQAGALTYATCRDCGNRTLERRPPLEYLDPITVRCIHPDCGAVFHPALVEYDLATYRESLEAQQAS